MSWKILSISAVLLCVTAGCGSGEGEILAVLHAGSLSVPFAGVEAAFEAGHPGVDVRRQAYGSAMAIRQVSELGKKADVVASADYRLIDRMMIESEPRWATWNLIFARNSICLVVKDGSGITAENWTEQLAKAGVRVGMSNPNQDPCGYRAVMALYLAQEALGIKGLFDEIILANSNMEVEKSADGAVIKVPGAARFGEKLVVRPKETDLLALIEAGALDCLFIYRSVAVQHGLDFVELPGEMNLGEVEREAEYGKVTVILVADRPESVVVKGGAIVYGVTVPLEAPAAGLAEEFVQFLVSEEGRRIFTDCGQEPLEPAVYSEAGTEKR